KKASVILESVFTTKEAIEEITNYIQSDPYPITDPADLSELSASLVLTDEWWGHTVPGVTVLVFPDPDADFVIDYSVASERVPDCVQTLLDNETGKVSELKSDIAQR
ncbi:MAG: hypothetical protein KBT01_06305, partial [Clostridiales bacterium]|nr:hypothetical protein [Candidatus Blautia equi]